MRRPSFQFYPGDWQSNSNLRRCTHAERGIWLDVMCLMHDQPEYGVLRWPLKEIAQAIGCPVASLHSLVIKGVMKGANDQLAEPMVYVPRSGRKNGDPVTLIPTQPGPIWYSSRMVKDEYVRINAGSGTRFGAAKPDTKPDAKDPPESSPSRRDGEGLGDGQSDGSSSSSSSSTTFPIGKGEADAPPTMTDPERRKAEAWRGVKSLLNAHGMPKAQTGTFVGKLVRDYGEDVAITAMEAAVTSRPAEPAEWLKAACQRAAGERQSSDPQWRVEQRQRTQQAAPGVATGMPADQFFIDVEAQNVTPRQLG